MPEFLQKFLSELSTEDAKKVFNWFEEDDDTKPMPKILEDHRNSFSTEQEIEFESCAYSIDPAEGREAIMDVIAVTHIGFRVF